jgi:hypothetical protein
MKSKKTKTKKVWMRLTPTSDDGTTLGQLQKETLADYALYLHFKK